MTTRIERNGLKVSKVLGDFIEQGKIVGLAGATGRVSGPHLHWGVKIHGNWVDGLKLVEESKKHFSLKSSRDLATY